MFFYCEFFGDIVCDDCFCFKHKTAYEMRISDWSSDVCSSDLGGLHREAAGDDAVAAGDRRLDARRRDHFVVEDDGKDAPDVVAGRVAEALGAQGVEGTIGRATCRERVCQNV